MTPQLLRYFAHLLLNAVVLFDINLLTFQQDQKMSVLVALKENSRFNLLKLQDDGKKISCDLQYDRYGIR